MSAFLDGKVGEAKGDIPKVGLVPAYDGITVCALI